MKTSTAELERGTVTHFWVAAREMLFDQPECCPIYGGLSFDGLAIDENDGVHLIVRTTSARAYLGPELPAVARRAHILAVALVDSGVRSGRWSNHVAGGVLDSSEQRDCRSRWTHLGPRGHPPELAGHHRGRSLVIGTPWWAAALIGVLTVVGAGFAAWIGANRTTEATRQREHAAAREEWFRRMQWAGQMALSEDERTRLAGLALLEVLARSPLAGSAELDMLAALNDNAALDRYTEEVDAEAELVDDGEDEEGQR